MRCKAADVLLHINMLFINISSVSTCIEVASRLSACCVFARTDALAQAREFLPAEERPPELFVCGVRQGRIDKCTSCLTRHRVLLWAVCAQFGAAFLCSRVPARDSQLAPADFCFA